jgi:hypothetical protein
MTTLRHINILDQKRKSPDTTMGGVRVRGVNVSALGGGFDLTIKR